jgi:hypothetical protein
MDIRLEPASNDYNRDQQAGAGRGKRKKKTLDSVAADEDVVLSSSQEIDDPEVDLYTPHQEPEDS